MPRILRSKITLIATGALLAFFGVSLWKILSRNYEIGQEVARLHADISAVESRNKGLSQLIQSFSAPERLEKEARLRLNLKKPDEEVLILPPDPNASPTSVARRASVLPPSFGAYLWELVRRSFSRSLKVSP